MPIQVTVYTLADSPRLRYVLDWLLGECLGLTYILTQQEADANAATHLITYGASAAGISIPNEGLLFETGIHQQEVGAKEQDGLYCLYPETDKATALSFDILSAIFFLLSRYEEYYRFTPDAHGRYAHAQSLLYRDGVLERPVVDEWVVYFHSLLEKEWNISIQLKPFSFTPTYDIDIAWSYQNKGVKRWLGAAGKELLTGNIASLTQRIAVARGAKPDPYDSFAWLQELHATHQLTPIYFILAALQATDLDKNIPLEHPAMQALVRALAEEGAVGIHPSYYSDKEGVTANERMRLGLAIQQPVKRSRQHFIRLKLPDTYRMLLAAGIDVDYSMGYANALGFRAGTGRSFRWYDLERETSPALRIYPFCFMDATAHYHLKLLPAEAFSRLRAMTEKLKATNSNLITVFHNFSLGTDPQWVGWREAYREFISSFCS